MSEYIVSARKYRPDSFAELIGQDNIAQTLKNSIARGKLAHAYLFCGPRGVGKTSTARIFAKTINCMDLGENMEPCGHCESCVSFQEGRSYCIHELDAASNNGVDDIKALIDQVNIPPQVGRYSVYIIDEVHMLSQAAFNAFLKTLEEPPAHAIFILATTEKHKILPTILSRCQTYDFNRISITDMVLNLRGIAEKEGVTIDDESLHVIAQKADGAMRDALTLFDQTVAFCGANVAYADVIRNLNVLDYEYSFRLVDSFLAGDYASPLLLFDEILAKGFNALHFVASLSSHLRDLVVTKSGGLDALLELPESLRKRYAEQASRCSLGFLYNALGVTSACEAGYKAAVNPRLHIEFTLMRLAFINAAPPVVASAARPAAPAVAPSPAQSAKSSPSASASPAVASVSATQASASLAQTSPVPAPASVAPGAKLSSDPEKPAPGQRTQSAATIGEPASGQPTQSVTTTGNLVSGQPVMPAAASEKSASEGLASASTAYAAAPATSAPASTALPAAVTEKPASATSAPASAAPPVATTEKAATISEKPSAATTSAASASGTAKPRRRKSASSLSLSSIIEERKAEAKAGEAAKEGESDTVPEDGAIREKWRELAGRYASRPRLANTLASAQLEITEDGGFKQVVFNVLNEAQQKWLREGLLRNLESDLQGLVGSSRIRLDVGVVRGEEVADVKYMPADQAKDLMAKNAEVKNLVRDLDLDIK